MGGPLTRRQVLAGTGVLVLAAALAGPAAGGSAEGTRGDFHAFAAGAGMGISGHVHRGTRAAGGAGDADGHYQWWKSARRYWFSSMTVPKYSLDRIVEARSNGKAWN